MSSKKNPAADTFDGVVERNRKKPTGADKEIQNRAKARADETLKEFQLQGTLQLLATTNLAISGELAHLQERLIAENQNLVKLQEAIDVKRSELQNYFDKEVVARELDALIAHYNDERERLDETIAVATRQFEDEAEATRQTRQREEEQYKYSRDLTRSQAEDTWAAQMTARTRSEEIRQQEVARAQSSHEQELKRTWALREQEIAAREKRFPDEIAALKASQEAQVAAVSSSLKTEARFAKADADGRVSLLQQEIALLKERLTQRDLEIAELRAARTQSETHVREIAMRGLETASSKMSFAENTLAQRGNEGSGGGNTSRKPS